MKQIDFMCDLRNLLLNKEWSTPLLTMGKKAGLKNNNSQHQLTSPL